MTSICLFVVLAALFITVFNSGTAHPISSEKKLISTTKKEAKFSGDKLAHSVNKADTAFTKKQSSAPALPTFS